MRRWEVVKVTLVLRLLLLLLDSSGSGCHSGRRVEEVVGYYGVDAHIARDPRSAEVQLVTLSVELGKC